MKELNRFIRHAAAPMVAWFVAKGYLPESMHGDVVELIVLGVGFAIPVAVSWWRDRADTEGRTQMADWRCVGSGI